MFSIARIRFEIKMGQTIRGPFAFVPAIRYNKIEKEHDSKMAR